MEIKIYHCVKIFCIWTEYGEIRSISPYSGRMGKNADKNNSEYGHFSRSVSIEEFFYKIRPYLKDNTNNFKKSDTWKIQLIIAINFMFSRQWRRTFNAFKECTNLPISRSIKDFALVE